LPVAKLELVHLIGRPYCLPSTPPYTFDCYSLVKFVRAEFFGLETPAPCDIASVSKNDAGIAIIKVRDSGLWQIVKQPRFGDIVQMERYHIGVYIEGGVLHAWRAARSAQVVLTKIRAVERLFSMCQFLRLTS
jgi:hypothetical protein